MKREKHFDKNRNTKQHTSLPKFYLKGFIALSGKNKGKNSVYSKQKQALSWESPKNITVKEDFYTTYTHDGQKNYSVEEYLSGIERQAGIVFKKLKTDNPSLTWEDKDKTADFLDSMGRRNENRIEEDTKELFDYYRSLASNDDRKDNDIKRLLDWNDLDLQSIKQRIYSESKSIEDLEAYMKMKNKHIGQQHWLSYNNSGMVKFLTRQKWCIINNKSAEAFITTDMPLVYPQGLLLPQVSFMFPLFYNKCLLILGKELLDDGGDMPSISSCNWGNEMLFYIKEINDFFYRNSCKLATAHDNEILQSIIFRNNVLR